MISTSELTDVPLDPLPAPGPGRDRLIDHRLRLARRLLDDGEANAAAAILEESLRAGLWRCAALWQAFTTMPHDHHDQVRQLWWDSPKSCHRMEAPLAVVARSAALSGDHETARALLRKAILVSADRIRRRNQRLRHLFKRPQPTKRVTAVIYTATDPVGQVTSRFFALHDAVAAVDRAAISTEVAALRETGEGAWLDRVI